LPLQIAFQKLLLKNGITELYCRQKVCKVSWQTETIFKSWKSGFNLQHILHEGCTDDNRLRLPFFNVAIHVFVHGKNYGRHKNVIEKKMIERAVFQNWEYIRVTALKKSSLNQIRF